MSKILIVDDSSFQRRLVRSLLSDMGHEVIEAETGAAGVRAATANEDLDAIFLDLLMPEMDGFTALERLQALGCKIPRIVLTADIQKRSRERCLELGAAAVVAKPPSEKALREVLGRVLPKLAAGLHER